VLFALVDANYQFLFTEIGRPGSNNDASIWHQSQLKEALDSGVLNLPPPNQDISYHFLGDEIFPLSLTLMKPFSRASQLGAKEKIYNYRFVLHMSQPEKSELFSNVAGIGCKYSGVGFLSSGSILSLGLFQLYLGQKSITVCLDDSLAGMEST